MCYLRFMIPSADPQSSLTPSYDHYLSNSEYYIPHSSFQSIILKFQDFWASHGCLITQSYYTQVGAGM